MLRFDHLVITATTLAEGVTWLQDRLGVQMAGGGSHAAMGTHNRLLGLSDLYLEVIAIDPEAPAPTQPRWFGLDQRVGPPRLSHWVARCDDLEAALALSPAGSGTPLALARGDYRWRMAVPDNGRLPFDDAFPALIAWQGDLHPAAALPDSGLRLAQLEIGHPAPDALRAALYPRLDDPRVVITTAPHTAFHASFQTADGRKVTL